MPFYNLYLRIFNKKNRIKEHIGKKDRTRLHFYIIPKNEVIEFNYKPIPRTNSPALITIF